MKTTPFSLALALLTTRALSLPTAFKFGRSATSTNAALALVTEIFPAQVLLTSMGTLIADGDQVLATTLGYKTTRADLDGGTCGDVMVVYAKGTDEPGNVGALVGPEFFNAIGEAMGEGKKVSVQGVDGYTATLTEYLAGGSKNGSANMAATVTKAVSQCPNTPIVMSGYSQGAQVVHKAASQLGSTMSSVKAVVTYGDPNNGTAVEGIDPSRVLVACHDGDSICKFGDVLTLKHLTYAADTTMAAAFVVAHLT